MLFVLSVNVCGYILCDVWKSRPSWHKALFPDSDWKMGYLTYKV